MAPLIQAGMGILGPILKDVLGSGRAADKIMKQVELRALEVDETRISAQQSILEKELNGTWMQRSWRPCLMFLFGFVIAFDLILIPVFNTMLLPLITLAANAAFSPETPFISPKFPQNSIPSQVWQILMIAIPGYIGARSLEKVANSATKGDSGPGLIERFMGKREAKPPDPPPVRKTVELPVASNDGEPFVGNVVDIPLQRGD